MADGTVLIFDVFNSVGNLFVTFDAMIKVNQCRSAAATVRSRSCGLPLRDLWFLADGPVYRVPRTRLVLAGVLTTYEAP